MPPAPQRKHAGEIAQHKREMRNVLIGEQVLHTLGEPDSLYNVQVRPLWEAHYRVNIFMKDSTASAKIANSYFVKTDRRRQHRGINACDPETVLIAPPGNGGRDRRPYERHRRASTGRRKESTCGTRS